MIYGHFDETLSPNPMLRFISQVYFQVGSFFKTFFPKCDGKLAIYNLIISYIGASLSWNSYILIEFGMSLSEPQEVFGSRYFSSYLRGLKDSGGRKF